MNKIFFLALLVICLSISIPNAYSEIYYESQPRYDKIITPIGNGNFTVDYTAFTYDRILSHYENNLPVYQDYINKTIDIKNSTGDITNSFIQIETMSASVRLDIDTCEFSFFDKGKIGGKTSNLNDTISGFQSVSGSGVWNGIGQINNADCVASWNGSELIAEKSKNGLGVMQYVYILQDGDGWKTELRATNESGLNNRLFGFEQYIELAQDTVSFGGNIVNLDNHDGQIYGRTWLANNEAKVIDFLDGYDFKFDKGFDNLETVRVDDTGVNSTLLTFQYFHNMTVLPDGQTIIIDPAFSDTSSNESSLRDGGNNETCDSENNWTVNPSYPTELRIGMSASVDAHDCDIIWTEFDTSGISLSSIDVSAMTLTYDIINVVNSPYACDYRGITGTQPSTQSNDDAGDAAIDASVILDADAVCQTAGNNRVVTFGETGYSYIENNYDNGWIAISITPDTLTTVATSKRVEMDNDVTAVPLPTLDFTYEQGGAYNPSPPNNLECVGLPHAVGCSFGKFNATGVNGVAVFNSTDNIVFDWLENLNNVTTYFTNEGLGNARTQYINASSFGANNGTNATSSTMTDTLPSTPTGLSGVIDIANTTSLDWTFASDGGDGLHNYTVRYSVDNPNRLDTVQESNIIGWIEFNNTVTDSSGGSNDGIWTGTEDYDSIGVYGSAGKFDGSSYITLANESNFDKTSSQPFTLSFLFKSNNIGVNEELMRKGNDVTSAGYGLYFTSSDTLTFQLVNTLTTNELRVRTTSSVADDLKDNEWHLVTIVNDGSNDPTGIEFYFDAIEHTDMTTSADNLIGSILNNDALAVGATSNGGTPITGEVDDFRFYDVALTPTEIQQIYNQEKHPEFNYLTEMLNPITIIKFDGDVLDSQNNADGTLTGTSNYTVYDDGMAFSSDGVSYTTLDNEHLFDWDHTDAFSYEQIIRIDSLAGTDRTIGKRTGEGWESVIASSSYISQFNAVSGGTKSANSGVLSPNIWYHFVTTYDGSSSGTGITLYQNGTSIDTGSGGSWSSSFLNNDAVVIGATASAGSIFSGEIADTRFYNHEMTTDDISDSYNNNSPPTRSNHTKGIHEQDAITYQVRSCNTIDCSPWSSNSTLYLGVAPPTSLTAITNSDVQINLEWVAPTVGDDVDGYKIERESPVGGGWSTLVADTGDTLLYYNNTGLTSSTQYNYRVSSLNGSDSSSPSNEANATTNGAPDAVTDLSAGSPTVDTITLSWTVPAPNGFAITGYKIERESPVGGGWSTLVADTASTSTSYIDTSLSAVTQYNYRISAINSYGTAPVSNEADSTTVTAPPENLVVNDNYHTLTTQLNLEWDAPTPSTGVNGYLIEREINAGGFSTLVANTTNTNTVYNDTSLSTSLIYNYRVSALTPDGTSQVSNEYDYTTHKLPDIVDDLIATATSLSAIDLTWSEPVHHAPQVDGYQINFTTPSGEPLTVIESDTGTDTVAYTVTGIPVGSSYSFRVAALTIHTPPQNVTNVSGVNATIANATSFSSFDIGSLNITSGNNPDILPVLFTETDFNSTTVDLDVRYPNTVVDFRCDFEYTFAAINQTYSGFSSTVYDTSYDNSTFRFVDFDNEIIDVYCWDNSNTAVNGTHKIQQSTIPFVSDIQDFQNGLLGTSGDFGAVDFITLLVIIVSMVGFNKANPAAGILISVMILGAASWFEVIRLESTLFGALALIVMLAIVINRKR